MQKTNHESRLHQRENMSAPVEIVLAQTHWPTQSINISPTGIALSRPRNSPVEPGQTITVRFSKDRQRNMRAHVVHVSEKHIGLQFETATLNSTITGTTNTGVTKKNSSHKKFALKRWLGLQARRAGILVANGPLRPLLVQAVRPQYLFAAYGTRKHTDIYYSKWMQDLLPSTLVCGLIRADGKLGLMVGSKAIEESLYNDPRETRDYLQDLALKFPSAKKIALMGRLPNFAKRANIAISGPLVDGAMGTRFMIIDAVRQARKLPGYENCRGITVLGGAGRIGDQVCMDLMQEFEEVIAFDTRYQREELIVNKESRILRTAEKSRLQSHRLLVCLTHHGDAIKEFMPYLPAGSLIADDTHPCISLGARKELQKRNINVIKIVLSHPRFAIWPRMPDWNADDLPGCLVEALVLLKHNTSRIPDIHTFSSLARQSGFQGILVTPPDY